MSNQKDAERYLANRQKEIDGAALYLALARSEKQPQMAEVYKRLAASEEKHAAGWEKKLDALKMAFPARTPSQRARILIWLAKRFGKDPTFLPPFGAAFDDKFINGQSFDMSYGYYNKGDTVAVKFCSIDNASYQFFNSMELVVNSQGNPFAAPSSIISNIYPQKEALGVWCGYGAALDTLVCK